MQSEELRTALTTLARIFGGVLLGGVAGALGGLVIVALVIAKAPALDVRIVLEAHVGNGAIFGAIAGSVVGPIVAAGPLAGLSPARWTPATVVVVALCADLGYLFGNFMVVRAAISSGRLPAANLDVLVTVSLLPEPVIGLLLATILGATGFLVVALAVRRRRPGA